MDTIDNKKLYEINENWKKFQLDQRMKEKIEILHSIIPDNVESILDVGCGNGLITNVLRQKFKIIGLDRSFAALKFVQGLKVSGNITNLPLKSNSVDLTMASELLEHLDDKTLNDALGEIQRIAKTYILISVPNREMLEKNAIKCPKCNTVFNASYHVQSFDPERLRTIFSVFKCLKIIEFGLGWRRYVPFLLKIRQDLGDGWFKIPPTRTVMCPNCDNTTFPKFKMNPIIFICDGINKFVSPRRPYYLIALFERNFNNLSK